MAGNVEGIRKGQCMTLFGLPVFWLSSTCAVSVSSFESLGCIFPPNKGFGSAWASWGSGEAALYCHEGWEGDDDSADGSFEKVVPWQWVKTQYGNPRWQWKISSRWFSCYGDCPWFYDEKFSMPDTHQLFFYRHGFRRFWHSTSWPKVHEVNGFTIWRMKQKAIRRPSGYPAILLTSAEQHNKKSLRFPKAFHAFPPDCELPGVVKVYEFRKGVVTSVGFDTRFLSLGHRQKKSYTVHNLDWFSEDIYNF